MLQFLKIECNATKHSLSKLEYSAMHYLNSSILHFGHMPSSSCMFNDIIEYMVSKYFNICKHCKILGRGTSHWNEWVW